MRFIDPDGMGPFDLVVNGGATATTAFKDEVNKVLGGFATFDIDKNGKASLVKTSQEGQMTSEQTALFDTFNKTITDKETTKIDVVSNDSTVEIGSFDTGQIDIADVKQLGSSDLNTPQFVSAQGAIGHEVDEQYQKQVNGETNVYTAHASALQTENKINGSTRQEVGVFGINNAQGNSIPGAQSIQSTSTIGNTTKTVDIITINGNVRKVNVN